MAETVELSELRGALNRPTQGTSSAVGMFLLTAATCDILAALHGDGVAMPVAALLAGATEAGTGPVPWMVAAIHTSLLAAGWLRLSNSSVAGNGLVEPGPQRSIGAPAPLDSEMGKLWAATAAGLLLLMGLLVYTTPLPVSRPAGLLLLVGVPASAVSMAALLGRGYAANRLLSNNTVLMGGGSAALLVLAASILVDRPLMAMGALDRTFTLVEGLLLCLVPIATVAALRSSQDVLIGVTVEQPQSAPMVVDYDPFNRRVRAARYLRFNVSRGQIVALSRTLGDESWVVEKVWDNQYHLPVHDRTLHIWNLSRLSSEITHEIAVSDSSGCFHLTLSVGKLMVSTRMKEGERYDAAAIAAATNVLFQNDDLAGLMRRTAQRAFTRRLREAFAEKGMNPVGEEVEAKLAMLGRAPTSTSVISGVDVTGAETLADISAVRMEQAKEQIERYRRELTEGQASFRQVKRLVSETVAELEKAWLEELASELVRAGEGDVAAERVNTSEALRVLRLIGLCSNGQEITSAGAAAECEERFKAVEQNVEQLFQQVSMRHEEVLAKEDEHGRSVEGTIIGKGRFSRAASTALAYDIVGRRRGRKRPDLAPPQPVQLLGNSDDEAADDEEDLN